MNPRLWFYDQGIHIFPIDRRDKSPAILAGTSQFDYRCTRWEAERIGDYGVPLGMLAVADSDSPDAEAWVKAHLPDTPFEVTTARGVHRYYRIVGTPPKFFHRAGLTIEFRNHGQYVVGPGSVHATGVTYTASVWSWNILDLPIFPSDFEFDDRPQSERGSTDGGAPLVLPPVIKAGERHDLMFKLMRSLQARGVTDLAVLLKVLHVENQAKCSPPIDRKELERYIGRVARYRDRPGFERDAQEAGPLAGGMLDVGMSVEAAIVLVKALDPGFDPGGEPAGSKQPEQPKQPFLAGEVSVHTENQVGDMDSVQIKTAIHKQLGALDMDSVHIEKPAFVCQKCTHSWTQRRDKPPRRCPQCRTTLWNRPAAAAEDGGEEPWDPLADEDGPIYDQETMEVVGHRKDGVITWDDEACARADNAPKQEAAAIDEEDNFDIYDEDTLEVVGHQKNGVITWKDAK